MTDFKFPMSTDAHTSGELFAFQCVLEKLKADGWDINMPTTVRSIAEMAFDAGLKTAKWDAANSS